jgi:hypothetical protein
MIGRYPGQVYIVVDILKRTQILMLTTFALLLYF